MKSYLIHLIRHGITEGNLKGTYVGREDLPLCDEGINDLLRLKEEFSYPNTPVLFSAPLKRCTQTAEILYPGIEPMIIDGFNEYNFGEFEGLTAEDLKDDEDFTKWLSGGVDAAPPFGETNGEFGKRISENFEKVVDGLIKTGNTVSVMVLPGGVLSSLMSMYALPEGSVTEWFTTAGCGYTVRVTPYLWSTGKKIEAVKRIPDIPEDISRDSDYSYIVSDIEEEKEEE